MSSEDASQSVRRHYDEMTARANLVSKRQRRALPTIPIRDFNNALKSNVISSLKRTVPSGCRVLDLCCGRGGDLFKLRELAPSQVVFVDISTSALEEAQRRYERGRRDVSYTARFVVADCFSPHLMSLLPDRKRFDIILCNFAVHYAFASESMATAFFANVESLLVPATGRLMLVYPHFETLRQHACKENEVWWNSFGNDVFTIEFAPKTVYGDKAAFGQSYRFSLDHAVDNCEEYLMPPEALAKLTSEFGLVCEWSSNFLDYAHATPSLARFIPQDAQFRTVCSLYAVAVYYAHGDLAHSTTTSASTTTNSVAALQTWCQRRRLALPTYTFTNSSVGTPGSFVAHCSVVDEGGRVEMQVSDEHVSKSAAKRDAAARMCRALVDPQSIVVVEPSSVSSAETDSPPNAFSSSSSASAFVLVDTITRECCPIVCSLIEHHPNVFFFIFSSSSQQTTLTLPSSKNSQRIAVAANTDESALGGALLVHATRLADRTQHDKTPILVFTCATACRPLPRLLTPRVECVTTATQLASRLLAALEHHDETPAPLLPSAASLAQAAHCWSRSPC
jgi:SAM-dependent methyltransferase